MHSNFDRPGIDEVAHWLFQPGKEGRASKFLVKQDEEGEYLKFYFRGFEETPFYYPKSCSWIDF
ncbi:MAG: hypothetical protein AAGH89_11330, partial [Verrucomicrobiota bacterium]